MSRSQMKRVARGIELNAGSMGRFASCFTPAGSDDAADLQRLKAALKKAVAKTDAPAYLIDAIKREVRK